MTSKNPELTFYDLKAKKKFRTSNYTLKAIKSEKGTRYFAFTTSPSETTSTRLISKELYDKMQTRAYIKKTF